MLNHCVMGIEEINKIMTRLTEGDESAFAELYQATAKGVYSFLSVFTGDCFLAEDITQETFIKVKLGIAKYRKGSNPMAWILTIAKNTALNVIVKRNRESELKEESIISDGMMEKSVIERGLVEEGLKQLNNEEKQIVVLYAVSGLKHREIAALLNKPLGSVLWSYRNSLKKLQKYFNVSQKRGG